MYLHLKHTNTRKQKFLHTYLNTHTTYAHPLGLYENICIHVRVCVLVCVCTCLCVRVCVCVAKRYIFSLFEISKSVLPQVVRISGSRSKTC